LVCSMDLIGYALGTGPGSVAQDAVWQRCAAVPAESI